jgi:outer membrane receptor protein involved in Fe transport
MRNPHPFTVSWPRRRVQLAASLALLAGAGCLPASAQSNAGTLSDLPLEQLLRVEVYSASRFLQDSLQAPSAVSVITREDIRTFGYRTITEALASVRGTYITYDRNYSYLGVRGFSRPGDYNSRILMLVDGYALNDGIYNQAPMGLIFPLDMRLVERIEFVPGPGSSLYGSNAFFGVVNVITRKAQDVGMEASTYAQSRSAYGFNANFGRKYESGLEVLLSVSRDRSRGADLSFAEFADVNNGIARGLDYEHAEKAYARLAYEGFALSMGTSRRLKGIPTAAFGTAFDVPGSQTEDLYSFADLSYRGPIGERSELITRASYHHYGYDGFYHYDFPPLTMNRDEDRASGWTFEGRVLSTLSDRHKLVFGAEYRRDGTLDQHNFDVDPFVTYLADERSSTVTGLYAQSEYFVRPDLILNLGLRHDKHEGFEGALSPRLAAVYLPQPGSAVKLLYGRAFRVPNFYERFYAALGTQKGNPDLVPERIATTELAYERTAGATRFVASLYHYRILGLIDQIIDPVDGQRVFVSNEAVTSYGADAELEHRFSSGLRLKGSVSLNAPRTEGVRLENSPRLVAKAFASAPLMGERLRAGLEAMHVGQRDGRGGVGSYTLLNFTATAKLAQGVELRASVYNLGDAHYADPGSVGLIQDRIEQDGRTLRVELSWAY